MGPGQQQIVRLTGHYCQLCIERGSPTELQKIALFIYEAKDFGAEQKESIEPEQTYTALSGKSYVVFKDVDLKMKTLDSNILTKAGHFLSVCYWLCTARNEYLVETN